MDCSKNKIISFSCKSVSLSAALYPHQVAVPSWQHAKIHPPKRMIVATGLSSKGSFWRADSKLLPSWRVIERRRSQSSLVLLVQPSCGVASHCFIFHPSFDRFWFTSKLMHSILYRSCIAIVCRFSRFKFGFVILFIWLIGCLQFVSYSYNL